MESINKELANYYLNGAKCLIFYSEISSTISEALNASSSNSSLTSVSSPKSDRDDDFDDADDITNVNDRKFYLFGITFI